MTVTKRKHIEFLLNDRRVRMDTVPSTRTLLDYLRMDARLTGSKEGCNEGDCGACTVLVGRLHGEDLRYQTVNACICFVGSLDGAHVVTIEHLRDVDGSLHPVQRAMVEHHGSQCGFCTPGIVMSLYALWMEGGAKRIEDVEIALQGNLCRCTGYAPIVKAGLAMGGIGDVQDDVLKRERQTVIETLQAMKDNVRVDIRGDKHRFLIPADVDDLARLYADHPGATLIAGATDVGLWVNKDMRDIDPAIFIGSLEGLKTVERVDGGLRFGAGVSYSEAMDALADHHPAFRAYWLRIGGEQVRNQGTLGGNIANGSPIGDTPPPFIALGASITLRRANERRTIPLEDFFIDYGKQDRQPGEFVETITLPAVPAGAHFAIYKISKRRDEDISALAAAFLVEVSDGVVASARIAFGGMAGTPKRAISVEAALVGKPWTQNAVDSARAAFEEDFTPLTDWRACADYRMLAAKNLLTRFHLETTTNVPASLARAHPEAAE